MRSILSIIALFSCCTLAAQEYIPTYGRELPRGEVIAYPTAQEAAAASAGDTRYFTRLADWTQKDNVFSTEFTVPFAWANRQVFFHLGWASADYEVRVNGKTVAYDSDCSTPAEFNLTRHAQAVSYTHLRAHETKANLVCRLLLEKKKTRKQNRISLRSIK